MSTAPSVVADAGPADIDWQELEARAHDDARLSFGYLALMIMAAVLAAIAILTDSVVMLIGAMIVAPDFGPIAGVSILPGLPTGTRRARTGPTALWPAGSG